MATPTQAKAMHKHVKSMGDEWQKAVQHHGQRVGKTMARYSEGKHMSRQRHGHCMRTPWRQTRDEHGQRPGKGVAKAKHGKCMSSTWRQHGIRMESMANQWYRQVTSMGRALGMNGKGNGKHCMAKTWQRVTWQQHGKERANVIAQGMRNARHVHVKACRMHVKDMASARHA